MILAMWQSGELQCLFYGLLLGIGVYGESQRRSLRWAFALIAIAGLFIRSVLAFGRAA